MEASTNPFAVAVMAHLKTRATRHDPEPGWIGSCAWCGILYRRNFGREAVLGLFRFPDWLLTLSEKLDLS